MSIKTKIDVYNKTSKTELEKEISKYVIYHRYYERLMVIKMIADGYSISNAASEVNRSYVTVHKWISACSKGGLAALKPTFVGGGHNAKLSKSELVELKGILEENPYLTLNEVSQVIKDKFGVEYTSKQVRVIVGKLGFEYRRLSPKIFKEPLKGE